ncbi:MAG: radical SAM protein, partial [Thermodesulfobacteriota bacterium]|nr:radical SAM protein [Thermodesulfobacteriota bacterium]
NASISEPASQGLRRFLDLMSRNHAMALVLKSRKLHDLVGSQLTVLPPDTRHVDYEVIPLVVADGCLYNCRFCRVKSGLGFAPRTKENIMCQIERLKKLYALDVRNYNSVFLGEHDALCAGRDLLEFAAKNAYEIFDFKHSHLRGANLFFFGSVNSLLSCDDTTFELLNGLPFNTHINIGLESADQTTLDLLNKPITVDMIQDAFVKMLDTNRRYENIEVTANFVFGDELPQSHLPAFFELTADNIDRFYGKGAIYFSPLANGRPKGKRSLLRQFYKVKAKSRLPTFLYLIQRL